MLNSICQWFTHKMEVIFENFTRIIPKIFLNQKPLLDPVHHQMQLRLYLKLQRLSYLFYTEIFKYFTNFLYKFLIFFYFNLIYYLFLHLILKCSYRLKVLEYIHNFMAYSKNKSMASTKVFFITKIDHKFFSKF